jgi:nicotinamidase-related amidase
MREALLVIDPLREFVYGDIRGEDPERILPDLTRLIDAARGAAVPVIFCTDEHLSVDRELKIWGPHAMKGSEGAQIVPTLAPAGGDFVVPKRTYSAFFQTVLDSLLRDLGAETLYVAGFYTDPCVRHTVADAFFSRYGVIVIADAVATLIPGRAEKDLEYMRKMYDASVTLTSDFVAALAGGKERGQSR